MRLGWGRGFFDKTLGSMERCPPVYAVVFDSEIVDEVPRDVHDQPVTGVVTPTQTIILAPVAALTSPRDRMPTYAYACKQCGHRFDAVQSFAEPDADRVPGVRRTAPQGVRLDRRDLQRLGLLPHRLARRRDEVEGGSEKKSTDAAPASSSSSGGDSSSTSTSSKSEAKASPASTGS